MSPKLLTCLAVRFQPRFRSMWERYCRGVQAIVFVVDAADQDLLDQARSELLELVAKPSLSGIPLLVLGNKNDLPGALSTGELIDRLDLKVWMHPCFGTEVCGDFGLLTFVSVLQSVREREVCVYSISCKNQNNIDITIEWLTRHARP